MWIIIRYLGLTTLGMYMYQLYVDMVTLFYIHLKFLTIQNYISETFLVPVPTYHIFYSSLESSKLNHAVYMNLVNN